MSTSHMRPTVGARCILGLSIPELSAGDLSSYVKSVEFKGFINNGYAIKIEISNVNFGILSGLTDQPAGIAPLLTKIRTQPVLVSMKLRYGPEFTNKPYPHGATRTVEAYIAMIYTHGEGRLDEVEIIAIDKLNWMMRIGDSFGGAYEGNVSSVIRQLFNKYAPGISISIPETSDNKHNVWWQFRRSPRSMLSHLLCMASSLSDSRVPWCIGIHNNEVKIAPITKFESRPLGYYRNMSDDGYGDIIGWDMVLNPSLGHHEMGIATAGVSSALGRIYDQTNDPHKMVISDHNTGNKYVPKQGINGHLKSTRRPETATFSPGMFGRGFVESPPEYENGGGMGVDYQAYVDAYARTEYCRDAYKMFTIDLEVKGHGVWDSTIGMGAHTVYLEWVNQFSRNNPSYFLTGNWLVYGFNHKYVDGVWTTVLNLSKLDHNASGQMVGL